MNAKSPVRFGSYQFDLVNEQLFQGKKEIKLRPKALAVLRHLVENPHQLMTKSELLDTVWPDIHVEESVLKGCIREIRKALGDSTRNPSFVETVHRKGYRFVASIRHANPEGRRRRTAKEQADSQTSAVPTLASSQYIVGREEELVWMQKRMENALRGERQVVFVTGEPGIGKTSLVDNFVVSLANRPHVWIGRGQCVEYYGEGEAYLPVFEAIQQLVPQMGKEQFVKNLSRYAPTWLAQMPAIIEESKLEVLQRQTHGATQKRMLREMAELAEAVTHTSLSSSSPLLVLILEDLQWSDFSTLDMITTLAQRREPARLLIIGTYRPVDVIVRDHPIKGVKRELQRHRLCEELLLEGLTIEAVNTYLERRFPEQDFPSSLGPFIHQRTEGNPFFFVTLVGEWLTQGILKEQNGRWELDLNLEQAATSVPENILHLIEQQIDRLNRKEKRVLEVASVVGSEFSSSTVAAGIEADIGETEEWCEGLTQRQLFLHPAGTKEWPDGTIAASYRFLHALYHKVWYERVTPARRQKLHLQIGNREEDLYGKRSLEHATELARHFEQGKDYQRAVQYLQQAASNALGRSAHNEALKLITKGLELIKKLPDAPDRAQKELSLQITLGPSMMGARGYAAPEVERAYERAQDLCQQVGETPKILPVLGGLWRFHHMRGKHQTALGLGKQLLNLAERVQDKDFLVDGHQALGNISLYLGEPTQARTHLEQAISLYDPQRHNTHILLFGHDPEVSCLASLSHTLWILGYPDQALRCSQKARLLSRKRTHPHSLAYALSFSNLLHLCRGDWDEVQACTDELMALATEYDFPLWAAQNGAWHGWQISEQGHSKEGLALIRQSVSAWQATGAVLGLPLWLSTLAKVYGQIGQAAEGLRTVNEAFAPHWPEWGTFLGG